MKALSKKILLNLCAMTCLCAPVAAATAHQEAPRIGIVDLRECLEKSLLGKEEKKAFETLKNQMMTALSKTETEINSLSEKFNDADYIDSLSAEAEQELQRQFRDLHERFARDQNQYYQMLNQANFKLIQQTQEAVKTASKSIAESLQLQMVINDDTCFYFGDELSITQQVLSEMDANFTKEHPEAVGSTESTTESATSEGEA